MTDGKFDVLVIGAGIAGSTAAAFLAGSRRVALLERESQPGYHSTGRSAALFSETYGNAIVRALSRASRAFLFTPPEGFAEYPLVRRRGTMHIARVDQLGFLEKFRGLPDVATNSRGVDAAEVLRICPLLRPDYAVAGIHEPLASDVDVHALHQGYLRMARSAGSKLFTGAPVNRLERRRRSGSRERRWEFSKPRRRQCCGSLGRRTRGTGGRCTDGNRSPSRTAVLVDPPTGFAIGELPNTIDIEEMFYFKPDAGQLFLSPADETPTIPCDAQPDEIDVAVAIDRVQTATILAVTRVRRKWAGLRSFAPDRSPVIGYDAR